MNLLAGPGADFFGLDIGTTAIRLVQTSGSGSTRTLARYGYVNVDNKLTLSDSKTDQQKLAQLIAQLVAEAKVTTKNVAVGLPSGRVFTTTADVERVPNDEMAKAIRYQADSLIPTPLAESKIDWALLGDSPTDKTKQEILLSSVPNSYIENRLNVLESVGLNVIAFEPDSMALCRALLPLEGVIPPHMILDMGEMNTDLVIMHDGAPRLTRTIATGLDTIVRAAMQNLNVDEAQAKQFVSKFGLSQDKLEGQIYHAVSNTVDVLTVEIEKSLKFFRTRYPDVKIERTIVTGGASAIPDFPVHIANKFGLNVEIGNAWRNISSPAHVQNELLAVSNQFSVAAGLAERNV